MPSPSLSKGPVRLAQIDDAGEYIKHHLTQPARGAMFACREDFTSFKDDTIE
jgi:hypothetical protein